MQPFPKKENTPDFSNPSARHAYVQETKTNKELMQKELDVNRAEQLLLRQRIELMKSFINDIPSSDPQYSMMITQVGMDQIELDELKVREVLLIDRISNN